MDMSADEPVPQGQGCIDRLGSTGMCPLVNIRDGLNQGIEIHGVSARKAAISVAGYL